MKFFICIMLGLISNLQAKVHSSYLNPRDIIHCLCLGSHKYATLTLITDYGKFGQSKMGTGWIQCSKEFYIAHDKIREARDRNVYLKMIDNEWDTGFELEISEKPLP